MAKTLSLNEIRKRAGAFVREWADEPGEERQQAQSFIRDLLHVYGITQTKAALYEYRARRTSTAHRGFIDALIPGLALIEMKSRGRDLAIAEQQALDYIGDLPDVEAPRFVLTSDFARFRLLDLHADNPTAVEFPLEQLPANSERLAFFAGYQDRSFGRAEQEAASVAAAQIMADLYESLSASGYDDHNASVFLVRVLFCLYADDSGIWGQSDLFSTFIKTRTHEDGSDLGPQLAFLFQAMNRPPSARQKLADELLQKFPYVNGGIFAEPADIPAFDADMRTALLHACDFNWSVISPAVFGSLFQAVKDPDSRRELGEHYTTETNILKTLEPLFLDELRDRFSASLHDIKKLKKLRADLGDLRILDPACGCGNFLVVAYRELRALDLDILKQLRRLGDESELPESLLFTREDLRVRLESFAGIEIEEWPARIAATALHLVDHQANQAMEDEFGMAPEALPLGRFQPIHVGNALRMDWTEIFPPSNNVLIVGNPPFIGQYTKKADQTEDLKITWGKLYDGYLDYVTGWYKKASDYFASTTRGRFAFVSTNSVTQGLPVPALFRPLFAAGWRLRFAHRTFAWSSEAAGMAHVHCVILGFDKNERTPARLYSYAHPKASPTQSPARNINPYLLDAPTFYVEKRNRGPLSPTLPTVLKGSQPTDDGNLLVNTEDRVKLGGDPAARKYLRYFVGARELIHGTSRWCLWLENLDPRDLASSPLLRSRLEACKEFRLDSKKAATRATAETPHLFTERRQPSSPYVCIPRHFSENRRFATVQHLDPDVIAGDANFTAEDPTGYLFAIMSSSMFLAWQRAVGGRIKSDLRFSATVVWNNLPLPELSEKEKAAIIDAGKKILDARAEHPDRSLGDHYNPLAMSPSLLRAHAALDKLVDKAFGARTPSPTDQERQDVLFKSYMTMTRPETENPR